ncbi:MAG: universal stress protein [Methanosarcinaceae archaeon]
MKILLPIDGSTYSKKAAKVAGRIAKEHNSHILVLHVVGDRGLSRKTWRKEGAEHVNALTINILLEMGCDVSNITSIVEGGNAAEMIVKVAKEHDIDRIIMGTRGRTGIKKIVGSVTQNVLQLTDILVLVVPPDYRG